MPSGCRVLSKLICEEICNVIILIILEHSCWGVIGEVKLDHVFIEKRSCLTERGLTGSFVSEFDIESSDLVSLATGYCTRIGETMQSYWANRREHDFACRMLKFEIAICLVIKLDNAVGRARS